MQKIHESTEMLTVYDQNLNPIGTRTREYVHNNGLLHQTVRLWYIQDNQIWFQKRSESKKLFPGRLDLAATGHIDPRETPLQAVIRETKEEIGIDLDPSDLTSAGAMPFRFYRPDGKLDNEFANIYLYRPKTTPDFKPGSEVRYLKAISIQDYERLIQTEPEKFCCPNQQEWDIIKRLTGIYLNKSRTTDNMPDIIFQETGQKTDQKEPIL